MRFILMGRGVGENRLDLLDRESEVGGDLRLIHTGFPVLHDVIDRHPRTFQNGTPALHIGLTFYQRALGPIHDSVPKPSVASFDAYDRNRATECTSAVLVPVPEYAVPV